ncbi:uncharacterized protein NMK_1322 [Novimethylophilus kurashikiensis]|uniref:Uncharacterized protein n=1 Tax=Novimethylophilus kurashikiensis TaxID=1825523 RepID=A0A2R5FAQ8_9PROT|nr:uncharacterized protein NMK_1322 [Novimethylophilus kurashikiensis]
MSVRFFDGELSLSTQAVNLNYHVESLLFNQ